MQNRVRKKKIYAQINLYKYHSLKACILNLPQTLKDVESKRMPPMDRVVIGRVTQTVGGCMHDVSFLDDSGYLLLP